MEEKSVDEVLQEILHQQTEILGMFRLAQSERIERNKQLIELIEKSESRIDRINEMVLNLTKVMGEMTTTYTHHIAKVTDSRDELIRQNSRFIEVLEAVRQESANVNVRYDALLDRYERLAERKTASNSINVK